MGQGTDRGYAWAAAHNIVDPWYENGNSTSFNLGVRLYAETRLRESHDAAVIAADAWRVGRGA